MKTSIRTKFGALVAAVALATLSACATGAAGENSPTPTASTSAEESAAAGTVSITHAQGTTDVPVNPKNVFVFDMGVLDSMTALGLEAQGVPEGVYPESLKKYATDEFVKIGSMKEPDFEAIAAGDPDLIIISGRTAGSFEELSKIAPTIDLSVDSADLMGSFETQARNLGTVFDKSAEVDEKLVAIEAQVAATKAKSADAGTALIVMTSAGELTAYGAGSRFGLIHDELGIAPATEVKHDGAHGEAISFEYIKEANPDILFVIDRDSAMGTAGDAAKAVLDNDLVAATNAAKNDRVIYLDSNGWYYVGYGLTNLPAMIAQVDAAL